MGGNRSHSGGDSGDRAQVREHRHHGETRGRAHRVAEDIAKLDTGARPIQPRRRRRPVTDDKIVNQAFELLASAQKPVILAGNGCIRRRASHHLKLFCQRTGIGVVSTFMAKGCVDMDADYCLYTAGLGTHDRVNLAIDEADLVISLGFDMVEYHPRLWNPNADKRIIHADFLPAEVDAHYVPEVELVGDLAHLLWMLNERLDASGGLTFDLDSQRALRRDMGADIAEYGDDDTDGTIRPQKALIDARSVLGRHDILLSDVGAHKMWIARHYHCHEPNTCLIPNGFCSMGFALPGAIAASLVFPERRVLAVSGDAGFLMNVQEKETARRLGSEITVLVWEDNEYGLIAWKQENEFGHHTDLSFGNPDWLELANAFGWNGYHCAASRELKGVLESSFREPGPSLVVIPIDYRENRILTRKLGEITATL